MVRTSHFFATLAVIADAPPVIDPIAQVSRGGEGACLAFTPDRPIMISAHNSSGLVVSGRDPAPMGRNSKRADATTRP